MWLSLWTQCGTMNNQLSNNPLWYAFVLRPQRLTLLCSPRELKCRSQSDNDKIWISTEQCSEVGAFEEFVSGVLVFVMFVENVSSRMSFFIAFHRNGITNNNNQQPTATKFNFLVPKICGFHFLVGAFSRTLYTLYTVCHTPNWLWIR